jgi:hypothetical protein
MATRWRWPPDRALGLRDSKRLQLQDAGGFGHLAVNLGLGVARHLQAKAHVFGHRHMRIKRVGLEHHRHAAFADQHRVTSRAPIEICRRRFPPTPRSSAKAWICRSPRGRQRRRTRRRFDLQVDPVDHLHLAEALGNDLLQRDT